jgi:predicted nucleotide-binding protein (sugar kinase/HSP70/actin superfamily)
MSKQKTACFPQIANYSIPVDIFVKSVLDMKTMTCPMTTKKTLELGSKHSPDYVCTPFKYSLGNYIEAIEIGADTLIIPAIGCRLGYYDEVQKIILKDLGYEFDMINLFEHGNNIMGIFKLCKTYNPKIKIKKFVKTLYLVAKIVIYMDIMEDYIRKNIGFEIEDGKMEKIYKLFLNGIRKSTRVKHVKSLYEKYFEMLKEVEIDKPENPIRVGIVGDLYTILEPFGNCNIEKHLAKKGIEIHRPMTLTHMFGELQNEKLLLKQSGKYLKYAIGGNATDSVAKAKMMAEDNIDGIIHIKAASCTPEITAMSSLQNISNDYKVPILYFTFDTETSETGVLTRIEAFHDMLIMKELKEVR